MIKRWVIIIHRWLGVLGCLLFAMWFFSGVVLMYVGFPNLTLAERLERLPPLNSAEVMVSAADAWRQTGLNGEPRRVRLNQPASRPMFHFLPDTGNWASVFADTGELVNSLTQADILANAASHLPSSQPTIIETVALDQWSVSSSLHPYRPLDIVAMNDAAGTVLYVSKRTGEVVRDTDRTERGWNWVGAIVHWIYPVQLRQHPSLWHDVVVWISVPATLSALSGIIIGIWRYRWVGQFKNGLKTPYRGWSRWHHWLGLIFALTTLTWIFSGLMSMNPWQLFSSRAPESAQIKAWRGGNLSLASAGLTSAINAKAGAREIEWVSVAGQPYFHVARAWNDSLLVAGSQTPTQSPAPQKPQTPQTMRLLPQTMVGPLTAKLMPNEAAPTLEWLDEFDLYYYAQHQQKRLPILRARFNDERATWFHIDPSTGAIIERLDQSNRVQRWLYNGLHSWNFRAIWDYRPLWDILLIVFSLGGFALSVTSVVIGWRRLRHKLRPRATPQPHRLQGVTPIAEPPRLRH